MPINKAKSALKHMSEAYTSILNGTRTVLIPHGGDATISLLKSVLKAEIKRSQGCDHCRGIHMGQLMDADNEKELEIRMSIRDSAYCRFCGRKID
jgi:hypothetical protein